MDVVLRVTAFGDLTGEEQSTEVQSYFTRGECAGAAETGPLPAKPVPTGLAQPILLKIPATVQAILAAPIDRLAPREKAPTAGRGHRHGCTISAAGRHH